MNGYGKKTKPNGWQHAKNKPMTSHENIVVFSESPMGHFSILGEHRMKYNPQGVKNSKEKIVDSKKHGRILGSRPNQIGTRYMSQTGFPKSVLEYSNITGENAIHPTQKPVSLYKYLIETYTNVNDTVIDICMGSGTTGVACVQTGRNFIGCEIDPCYFEIAQKRIKEAQMQLSFEFPEKVGD